ncbi:MAG: SPOR domain-containing protein [Pacificimonas sp.]|jgi:tetratricopeptide (TPR) repeat protein|nr:SPOR domain-containing protein [Pacificimonas sp.]
MPSLGAKLAATTIIASAAMLSGCAHQAPGAAAASVSARAALADAPVTTALFRQMTEQRAAAARSSGAGGVSEQAARAESERLAGDTVQAIRLAEAAIAANPGAAAPRRTLAQAYFAAGRFASARDAYEDLLVMKPGHAVYQVGAALAALANGDEGAARAYLDAANPESARAGDVGLAYVLLGEEAHGLALLEGAVRSGQSTARTRQNLALAQALAGRWGEARLTAAIDLDAEAIEQRVAEWAALMASEDAAWRMATILDIAPVAADAGRPVALAYVEPVIVPAPTQLASPQPAAPQPEPRGLVAGAAPTVVPATPQPVLVATDEGAAEAETPATSEPALAERAPEAVILPVPVAAPRLVKANALTVAPRAPKLDLGIGDLARDTAPEAPALPKSGDGNWVVQLGSYHDATTLKANWRGLKSRTAELSDYTPKRSKVTLDGTVYHRLSVGRFDTADDARALCDFVKDRGENCFIREGKFQS